MDVLVSGPDYRIGRFTLKPFRQLLDAGGTIPIGRKALDLLSVLAKAEGALVTKDELMAAVWPKAIVEDNAIQAHIAALRKALGEDAELLSTVRGLGYRLTVAPQVSRGTPRPDAPPELKPASRRLVMPALWAALVVIAVVAPGLWFLRDSLPWASSPPETRVAVLPFDTLSDGPQARHFADALTDEIRTRLSGRIQVVSRDDAASLRGADRDRKLAGLGVSLLLDGTVQDDGNAVKIRIHLDDPVRHATLWSGSVDGLAANSDQMQASIASTIVAVLACSNRALAPVHGLTDPDLLTRYLHACDILVNGTGSRERVYEVLASLREVAAKAPGFAPIHSDFAKYAPLFWSALPPDQAAALRREAEAEAHKALALDPKSPDAYLGLSQLLPPADWAGREKLLRQGVAGDPDWPFTNGVLGLALADTGRLQEAIGYLQKAVASDLQFDFNGYNGVLQCGSGQFEPMTSHVVDALKLEARYTWVGYTLRRCLKYARRWADLRAMAMTPPAQPAERADPRSSIYDVYLAAEESGKPADVARARNAALAATGSGSVAAIGNAIEALSVLGFTDDAFAVAQRFTPRGADDAAFLFYTLTAPLRRDPRFMQLSARIGLVDYWRSSGHWPDFCSEPGLPYDCRAEAAKVA
ncbi:MAG TPA: winged helix-turn-helix domain-containing protein, partial [Rhizomicrobium sp.]|nr:winged helix-turn-helix domain-containing protein [Rhizomicrobium sp.]